MALLFVLAGIILLLVLILLKLNPMIALLVVSIVTGMLLGMPITKIMGSISAGVGNTLASVVLVLALGAMLGKMVEDAGMAKKIVVVLMRLFGRKHIQWAVLLTGFLVGIPLFYNAGFVVLIPLVFAVAAVTRLPLLYVGIPMAAALSTTHGFLPPHPGPTALAGIFKADVGKTLLYGLALSVPAVIVAGIVFPRVFIRHTFADASTDEMLVGDDETLPPATKSFLVALLPVLLIAAGTIGSGIQASYPGKNVLVFFADPTAALLLSVIITVLVQRVPVTRAMKSCVEGVKSVAMIIMIIAAGGAFKQILVDGEIGEEVKRIAATLQLSPLFLGWLIAALLRITLGSATVAALTASGMVLPFVEAGVSPELLVLAVGSGSLMLSHVNDTGFWMFKEYFELSLRQTFSTWTLMETIISFLGLGGVLLLDLVI